MLALPGLVIVVGITVFALRVFRGLRKEITLLLRILVGGSFVVVLGGALETLGLFGILGVGWSDVYSDERLWASLMRLLSGALLALGFGLELAKSRRAIELQHEIKWGPGGGAGVIFAGLALGVFSFAFDGHTVSQGPRAAHALLDVIHVVAGSVWLGGLAALTVLGVRRRSNDSVSLAPMVVRFSSVATLALVVVGLAGVAMSWLILDGVSDLFDTTWGRILAVKVTLVAIAAGVGAFNHFVVVPAFDADPNSRVVTARARRAMLFEAVILVGVAFVTVFLTGASTT